METSSLLILSAILLWQMQLQAFITLLPYMGTVFPQRGGGGMKKKKKKKLVVIE